MKTLQRFRFLVSVVVGAGLLALPLMSAYSADADVSVPPAAPYLSAKQGTSGVIEIFNSFALARFYLRDMILRDPDVPGCVAFVRLHSTRASNAGVLTVSSDLVGPLTLEIVSGNQYELFLDNPPVFFPAGTRMHVQVQLEGSPGIPALPVTTLESPAFDSLAVTAPDPADGPLTVMSNQAFPITWTPPDADAGASAKMIFVFWFISGPTRVAEIRCETPVLAGHGTLPASLLSEVRRRVDPTTPVTGAYLRIVAGDRTEVTRANSSYIIEVAGETATSFGEIFDVTLD